MEEILARIKELIKKYSSSEILDESRTWFDENKNKIQTLFQNINLRDYLLEPNKINESIDGIDKKIDELSEKLTRLTILGRLGVK